MRVQRGQDSYRHYVNLRGSHDRRSFNNIFVAVHVDPTIDVAITFIPSPLFPAATDGNAYYRIGAPTSRPYRYLPYASVDASGRGGSFACLAGCDAQLAGSTLVEHSTAQYAPGYEASSIKGDPQFRRIGADGVLQPNDDLRLAASSPARTAGIPLPADLWALDRPLVAGTSAVGCFRGDSGPLRVGVDGRRIHPASR